MDVQTVTGPVSTAELGMTFMHEHVVAMTPGLYTSYPHLYDRAALLERAIAALRAAHARGLRTLVDMSPADFHRDPELVREASLVSGVQVIHATGLYNHTTLFFRRRSIEQITELLVRDITVGMGETGIRAGILKCAVGPEHLTDVNDTLLRSIARAHRATGVPIGTHTDMAERTGLDQQLVFKSEGVDLGRVIIGHSNDTMDIPYLEELIEAGSWVGMDRFGIDVILPETDRIELLVAMCDRGYSSRIVLSHDANSSADFVMDSFRAQPYWNWNTIPDRIVPALRERGVREEDIRQMLVENPRAIFEQQGAY